MRSRRRHGAPAAVGELRPTGSATPLGLRDDDLVRCVACGLCLPHCPTYRVTGLEIASPRGRIAAMRAVESGAAPIDATFERAMLECVQCRGCESACPSAVPYGRLIETARSALATAPITHVAWWSSAGQAVALRSVLPRHRLLLGVTWLVWAAQRLRLVPKRLGVPRLSATTLRLRLDASRGAAPGTGEEPDAWLFTGCVMDAWSRDTHAAALKVMHATGARVRLPGPGGDCCGALHAHAGRESDARRLAERVIASMPGGAPIVVDSAGCGAAMQDYGRLVGTPAARSFAARVQDFSSWLQARGVPSVRWTGEAVVVQDACHLRHVQRAHPAVRSVLADAYDLRETDDEGMCCGAGGAYSLAQPDLSGRIRERKVDALARACEGLDPATVTVVSANPGCTYHLRAAGLTVRHPAELLADALSPEADPDD